VGGKLASGLLHEEVCGGQASDVGRTIRVVIDFHTAEPEMPSAIEGLRVVVGVAKR
jgi:hypothetical protein